MTRLMLLLGCVLLLALPVHAPATAGTVELDRMARLKLEEFARRMSAREVREAAGVLHELVATPEMDRLADTWPFILYNLACCHSLLGERDQALSFLQQAAAAGFSDPAQVERDPDLAGLHDDPGFAHIVQGLRAEQTRWNSPALRTPYRETPGEDEKMAGLARVWSEIKFGSANLDAAPGLDWDSLYVAFIPKVRQAHSTLEYYRLLQQMCARLGDSHTDVDVPPELFLRMYSRPPVDTRFIEGRVIISAVLDDSLRKQGIRPGLEILKVDGLPVRDHAKSRVAPYVAASTPQGLAVATYEFYLLCGPYGQPVTLELADSLNRTLTRTLRRTVTRILSDRRDVEFRILRGNIGYVALNSFGGSRVSAAFDSLLPAIRRADALVLDVRRNTGGNSDVGFNILGCLADSAFAIFGWQERVYRPLSRARGLGRRWEGESRAEWPARASQPFRGPVAVITGPRTGSAAEDFCVAFDVMGRGEIVGAPTAGSTGQPLNVPLPGGGSLRVCTLHCTYPDGREYAGVGVEPAVLVHETVRDLRAGRDIVLETAVGRLKRRLQGSSRGHRTADGSAP